MVRTKEELLRLAGLLAEAAALVHPAESIMWKRDERHEHFIGRDALLGAARTMRAAAARRK